MLTLKPPPLQEHEFLKIRMNMGFMCLSCAQGLHAQFLLDLTHTWTNHKLPFPLSLVLYSLSLTQEELLGVILREDYV